MQRPLSYLMSSSGPCCDMPDKVWLSRTHSSRSRSLGTSVVPRAATSGGGLRCCQSAQLGLRFRKPRRRCPIACNVIRAHSADLTDQRPYFGANRLVFPRVQCKHTQQGLGTTREKRNVPSLLVDLQSAHGRLTDGNYDCGVLVGHNPQTVRPFRVCAIVPLRAVGAGSKEKSPAFAGPFSDVFAEI